MIDNATFPIKKVSLNDIMSVLKVVGHIYIRCFENINLPHIFPVFVIESRTSPIACRVLV